jgi:pilus assembly protein CpaC
MLLLAGIAAIIGADCGISQAAFANRQIVLKVGGSELKDASSFWPNVKEPKLKRISAIDDRIVDVQIVSPKTFYILGKDFGSTSLMVWEKDQEDPVKIDVIVLLDLTTLKQKLHELYPDQQIDVYASETGVVLSGTVSGPEVVEQVIRLTQNFLPKKAEAKGKGARGTGTSGDGITNLLQVANIQQVMLEVKFAEVDRSKSRDWQAALGLVNQGRDLRIGAGVNEISGRFVTGFETKTIVNPDGSTSIIETAIKEILPFSASGGGIGDPGIDAGSMLLNFAGNAANIFVNIDNVTAALTLLENEGLARVLAEPRLVTLSGQEASFLAGGEFPIPVLQSTGGVSNGITIEYKEFGVGLRFTPVVMSNGTISLRVAPSVSDIAASSTIPTGIVGADFIVPSLTTRKLDTTVQLKDGQTLALAGLLSDSLREQVDKIPGLGNLPIIGALFRSSGYLHQKTDLLIAVTPHLVKPVKEGTLSFPGENLVPPNAWEFYLEGKMEGRRSPDDVSGLSQHAFTTPANSTEPRGGLEGEFGHEPVPAK